MTRKGVWDLQEVRDKYLESEWVQYNKAFIVGNGTNGTSGLNNNADHSSPIQLPGQWNVVLFEEQNGFHAMGVRADNTLWTWGSNSYGQLGVNKSQPTLEGVSSPTQVPGSWKSGFGEITCSRRFCGAIKTDGTLWMWGVNQYATLGLNDTNFRSSPTQVPGTWTRISGGNNNSAGIKDNGELYLWGFGAWSGYGPNKNTRSSPYQIPGTWSEVCCSKDQILATKTDGTLWSWGKNDNGQLGQNNLTHYSSPRQVGTNTNWKYIGRAGQDPAIWATNTAGELYTWGKGESGCTGHNYQYGDESSPKQLPGTNWSVGAVNCADRSMAFTKTDGTAWAWGENGNGNLGQNDTANRSSPVQIPGTWLDGEAMGNTSLYKQALD